MQKKILASLMVTPLAFNALANITINGSLVENGTNTGWDQTGITGDTSVFDGTGINCPVGTGILTKDLGKLNPGTYKVSFVNAENLDVTVTLEGQTVNTKGDVEFTVTAENTPVTLRITSADGKAFSFSSADLVLLISFADIQAQLDTALDEIVINEVVEGDNRPEAAALRTEYTTLTGNKDAIGTDIAKLDNETLDIYNEFRLWADPNKIQEGINALKAEVEAYNAKVAAENQTWQTIQDNTAALNEWKDKVAELNSNLARQETNIANAGLGIDGQKYLTETTKADIEDIKADISAFENDINKQYADLTKPGITVTDQTGAIQGKIDELAAKITKATADWKAYTDLMNQQAALTTKLQQATEALAGLKGVEGHEDVFKTYLKAQQDQMNQVYSNALDAVAVQPGTIAGAADKKDTDMQLLQDAATQIDALLEAAQDFVAGQNQRYNDAIAEVKTRQDELLSVMGLLNLPDDKVVEFQQLRKEAQDAITALKNQINGDYTQATPDVKPDYDTQLAEIDGKITSLKEFVGDWEPLCTLISNLDDLRQYVANVQEKSKIPTSEFDLSAKFAGTYVAIDKAITDLAKALPASQTAVAEIQAAIDKAKESADKLMGAYVDVAGAIQDFQTQKEALDKAVAQKEILAGSTWNREAFLTGKTYQDLAKQLADFEAALDGVKAADHQAAYDQATGLKEAIDTYGVAAHVNSATMEFETAATEANYIVVDNALAAAKTYQAEGEYYGKGTPDLSPLGTRLDGIRAALDTAENADEASVPAFTKVDTDLAALLGDIEKANNEIKALKDNQAAYDTLTGNFAPALQDAIDALVTYNNDNSLTPAREHYAALINGTPAAPAISLQAQADAIKVKIDKALQDKTAVADQAALQTEIDALKAAVDNMQKAIKENNAKHDGQLVKSDDVRGTINGYLQKLDEADQVSGAPALTEDWRNTLNGLLENDMTAADLDVNKAYGNGESAAKDNDLIKAYDDILKQANDVMTAYGDTFGDRVKDTNNATVSDAGWTSACTNMIQAYNEAIKTYNSFFSLDNTNYRDFILPVVKTHEPIFQYYAQILELEKEVSEWVDAKTAAKEVFTPEEFKAVANEKAAAKVAEINGEVADMLTHANKAAKVYYNGGAFEDQTLEGIHNVAGQQVADARTALNDAGVDTTIADAAMKAAEDALGNAEKNYVDNETAGRFCLDNMNTIANLLESIPGLIDLQQAATKQWDADYATASATLATLAENLKKIVDADDESLATMAGYVAEASALDDTAKADQELIKNLKADKAELDRIVSEAQALYDAKKDIYDADQANSAQKEQFAADINDLRDALAELHLFADGIAGGDAVAFDAIAGLIDYAEQLCTVTYPSSLVAHKDEIQAAIDNASNAIDNGYITAKDNEIIALNQLLGKTKVAFNNVEVAGNLADELADINAAIVEFGTSISALNGIAVPEAKDDFTSKAQAIETDLSSLYVKLMSNFTEPDGGNPVPGILEELQNRYDTVNEAITAGQTALDNCLPVVKEEYADAYTELKGALDALQAAWMADGNKVVFTNGAYVSDLEALAAQVEAKTLEIKEANDAAQVEQDRIDANNNAFTALTEQLDGYQTRLDSLKTLAEGYGVEENVDGYISNTQNLIDNDRQWLADENEGVRLTSTSELPSVSDIERYLDYILANTENLNCINKGNLCNASLTKANEALAAKVVPEIKAEQQQILTGLINDYNNLLSEHQTYVNLFNTGEITAEEFAEKMQGIVTGLDEIADKAADIEATAQEYVFVPGDVNLNPDGEVNAVDLQMLIGWIGHDVTYTQLYEQSPRQAAAADITGDKDLNIADATALVQLILDQETPHNATPRRLAPRRGVTQGQSVYTLALEGKTETGNRGYVLMLNNAETLVGAQLDLTLPAGMTLAEARLGQRAAAHEVMVFDNGNGNYRLVIMSMTNAAVAGSEGALLYLDIEGVGNPVVENLIFADQENNSIRARKADQSMIDSIVNGATNMRDRIYNVAGQTMRAIQRGVNIIRHADGSTTKEIH